MHAIRLRHPWQRKWNQATPDLLAESTVPGTSLSPNAGREPVPVVAHYQRSFNRPSGLLPEQAVWLVIETLQPFSSSASIPSKGPRLIAIESLALNARALSFSTDSNRLQARVEAELEPFNRLEIVCALSDRCGPPPELAELMEVRLEIS